MVRRKKFGKTWWGGAWIEALEDIDSNTNRLPRGRRYAGQGMVEEINIKGGNIEAKVSGRRVKPYRETITLKSFSPGAKEKVLSIIKNTPALWGELSNGQLPEELLSLLEKEGIDLLPKDWDDLRASCSCPDWANPCKHLAAVYYIVGNEIDKDPFLLFQLRGMEKEKLKSLGAEREAEETDPFIPLSQSGEVKPAPELPTFPDIDFPGKNPDKFLDLLKDNPLFYGEGNFKTQLKKMYRDISRSLKDLELEEIPEKLEKINFRIIKDGGENKFFGYSPEKTPGRKSELTIPIIKGDKLELKETGGNFFAAPDFFQYFVQTPLLLDEKKFSSTVIFLSASAAIAQSFAQKSSFFPRVVDLNREENSFRVEYAFLNGEEKITQALKFLEEIYPPELIFRSRDGAVLPKETGVREAISLFLGYFVGVFSKASPATKVERAFFQGETYIPAGFEEKQTAKNIKDWLGPLQLPEKDLGLVLKISIPERKKDQFELEVEIEDKKSSVPPVSVKELYSGRKIVLGRRADTVQRDVARYLTLASEHMPRLKEFLQNKGAHSLGVSLQEMGEFLAGARNILEILGFRILLPSELKKLMNPQPALTAGSTGNIESIFHMEKALQFSWQVSLGDEKISPEEFKKLTRKASGLIRYRDSYFFITPGQAQSILKKLNQPVPQLKKMDILRGVLTGEIKGNLFVSPEELEQKIREMTKYRSIQVPKKLVANLRPYQKRGYRWLFHNLKAGFGSCLADDMGLGKTIQAIAVIQRLKQEGSLKKPSLIIAPTSLLGNWEKETQKFAPELKTKIYHGKERRLDFKGNDLVLTTYQIAQREIQNLKNKGWELLILDEAQNIKNPASKRARAIKSINSGGRVALTGTPVENRLQELWSIMDFLNPGLLGGEETFRKEFAIPVEKYRDRKSLSKLKMIISPFFLRREKTDKKVISDLPEKNVRNQYCYLTSDQAALYQTIVDRTWNTIENSDGMERRGLIFKLFTALKQVCNHPVQYTKTGEILPDKSGKLQKTLELLKDTLQKQEKTIIFTQYREMGTYLQRIVKKELHEEVSFFHGGLTTQKREAMVSDFQNGATKILIVSLRAGGTGMNLTAATNVIHYDLWWNPAVENQATDRTHRIGQKKNVQINRLITLGTLEEKIEELLQSKKELVESTISTGGKWISELSNIELREIIELGKEGIADNS